MAEKGVWDDLSASFRAGLQKSKNWRTAGEREDWLRTKGKVLGYLTEVLANRLRELLPLLPAKAEYLVFGYVTPVAAECVRREIWCNGTLSTYDKAQIYGFTLRSYAFMIARYRGKLPPTEECIADLLRSPLPFPDPAFATRMGRVTADFEVHFTLENRSCMDAAEILMGAFVGHVLQIVRHATGRNDFDLADEACVRLLHVFTTINRVVRETLAE